MARVPRTKAEWAELQARQEASGQAVKEWCTDNGININTMYNQNAKKRREQTQCDNARAMKTTDSAKNRKAISNTAKPKAVEWKEIKL